MHLLNTMGFVSHTCPRTAKKDIQVNGMLLTTKFIMMNTILIANFYLFAWYDFIYTGDVVINATYRLTDENALELSFIATTTKATPINLSSHCYFNLGKNNWLINWNLNRYYECSWYEDLFIVLLILYTRSWSWVWSWKGFIQSWGMY